MESLPLEIIAYHIFKYFDFTTWLKSFIFVCKFWRQAAIQSTASKQIVISLSDVYLGKRCTKTLSTFNVDTIIFEKLISNIPIFSQLINASNKLNTIVITDPQDTQLHGFNLDDDSDTKIEGDNKQPPKELPTFPQISTLAIGLEHLSLLRLFPNVTKLKILTPFKKSDFKEYKRSYPSVKEIEVVLALNVTFESKTFEDLFPNLETMYLIKKVIDNETITNSKFKIIMNFKHLPLKYIHTEYFDLSATSYHHFTYSNGRSPLSYLVEEVDVGKAIMYMDLTTPEYEADLRQRAPCFIFPPLCVTWQGVQKEMEIPNAMPVSVVESLYQRGYIDYWHAFVVLANKDCGEALKHLAICSKHFPPTGDIGEAVAKLFKDSGKNTKEILEAIGGDEETLKTLVNYSDEEGSLAFRLTDGIPDLEQLIPYLDLTKEDPNGYNPATVAFNSRNFRVFVQLRSRGVKLEITKLKTPALQGFFTQYVVRGNAGFEPIKYLQKEKGEISVLFERNVINAIFNVRTPDKLGVMKYLVEELGENFYAESAKGESLIGTIINYNKDELTKYMLSKIDVNHVDSAGLTPLLQAIKHKKLPRILLEHGANVNFSSGKKSLPIVYAAKKTKITTDGIIEELIEYGADINTIDYDSHGRQTTPLATAIYCGKLTDELKLLVNLGADPKFIDEAGNTLMHTLMSGVGAMKDVPEVAKFLSEYHVDINQKNNLGESPLHFTLLAAYGESLIEALNVHGADVNLPGPLGRTPLMMAVLGYTPSLVPLLATNIIDLKARDVYGRSFVHYLCHEGLTKDFKVALKNEKLVAALAHYASEENIEFIANEVREYIKEFKDTKGLALFFERATGHILMTKFLVEKVGLDVNMEDKNRDTMLSCIYVGKKNTADVIEYLISKGAKVDHQDLNGDTLLMKLLQNPSISIAQYRLRQALLKHGASVTIKNNRGISPIEVDPMIETRYEKPLEQVMSLFDIVRSASKLPKVDLTKLRRV